MYISSLIYYIHICIISLYVFISPLFCIFDILHIRYIWAYVSVFWHILIVLYLPMSLYISTSHFRYIYQYYYIEYIFCLFMLVNIQDMYSVFLFTSSYIDSSMYQNLYTYSNLYIYQRLYIYQYPYIYQHLCIPIRISITILDIFFHFFIYQLLYI